MFEFYNIFENETSFDFFGILEKEGKAYKIRKNVKFYDFFILGKVFFCKKTYNLTKNVELYVFFFQK